jgi:hypothetical protein
MCRVCRIWSLALEIAFPADATRSKRWSIQSSGVVQSSPAPGPRAKIIAALFASPRDSFGPTGGSYFAIAAHAATAPAGEGFPSMSARLIALDEAPNIALDQEVVVAGRHPACDVRLDSLRVSRHDCCITRQDGDLVVRDLGSSNGIRINGQRVEIGLLRLGDELSIAHLRYRLGDGPDQERASTPPRDPIDAPPSVSTEAWIEVRPSARGFGPMNGVEFGRTRDRQSGSSRLRITARNLQNDCHRFRGRSVRLRGSLHVLTIRRYR